MPELSRFFGIVITMHYEDHAPPHFHVRYAGRKASLSIQPLELLTGRLPPRVLGLVIEWAAKHPLELQENWERARRLGKLKRIAPLE
ncbi:MAG: DUF4160 domain-containing protein [Planctomycetes bacterium]|jgi:hypothetical protein|nr:DUF4160 domain-containing protein [Planctomycetota bacterium]